MDLEEDEEERQLPTCPICAHIFYPGDREDGVNAHLASCARKARVTAATTASDTLAGTPGESTDDSRPSSGTTPERGSGIVNGRRKKRIGVQMSSGTASHLTIGLSGDDLGSVVASIEELAARGLSPTTALCDRAMQELLKSRCTFFLCW